MISDVAGSVRDDHADGGGGQQGGPGQEEGAGYCGAGSPRLLLQSHTLHIQVRMEILR